MGLGKNAGTEPLEAVLSHSVIPDRTEITVCGPELGPPKPNRANLFRAVENEFAASNPPVCAVRADSGLVSLHSLFPFIRILLVSGRTGVVWKHFGALTARKAHSFSSASGCGP